MLYLIEREGDDLIVMYCYMNCVHVVLAGNVVQTYIENIIIGYIWLI